LRLGQIVRPLDTVAAYIPSGRYPLPSTILMTVVPAQVAGVRTICVASPRPVTEVFGTAGLLGVEHVFEMGGAQAIAAFAYGTRTVPRADRIVGPGNIYVAAAKKLLAGEVGIDFVAGPTEILIISADGDPRHLAADMLAQAEHDVDASAVLLTTSKRLAAAVVKEVDRQLATLPTAAVARQVHRAQFGRRVWCVRWTKPSKSPIASRPSISAFPMHRCYPVSATRAVSSWARTAPKRRAITRPDPTTSCPPAAPRASAAACRSPIS
jgi:histidinol dehydrogenase